MPCRKATRQSMNQHGAVVLKSVASTGAGLYSKMVEIARGSDQSWSEEDRAAWAPWIHSANREAAPPWSTTSAASW